MTKKLILTVSFCLITSTCFAQDYYAYVRTYNKYDVDIENNKGRSKRGDIVEITRVKKDDAGNDRLPTDRELSEWAIYKVSGLTDIERAEYRKAWVENENTDNEITKANRRYKFNLPLVSTKGFKGTITAPTLKTKIKLKTNTDLTAYEQGRKFYALTYPVRKFYRKFIEPFAYAAETISTINRTGETYGTITLWEDAKDGNITAGNAEVAECYDDDGALSDTVTFLGWTTDADSYVKVIAPKVASVGGTNERHSGTVASGFNVTGITNGDETFMLQSAFDIYFEGLIIGVKHGSTNNEAGIRESGTGGNANVYVSYCVIYDTNPGIGNFPVGILLYQTNVTLEAWNNIIYDFNDTDGTGGKGIQFECITGKTQNAYVYNNTITDGDKGIIDSSSGGTRTFTIKNNICNGNAIDYTGTLTTNGFNISEDTSSPDVAYRSFAVTFDGEVTDDFTVDDSANDTTLDDGEDLSADATIAFSDDIEGATRTPWYIGASEGPAVSGVRRIILIN